MGKELPTVCKFDEIIQQSEYNFLRENSYLGHNIVLLGLGGSHAYGMNNENSDVDIRGIATNSKQYILTGRDFEQVVDVDTDTTIYSFDKMVKLLCACNPNTIEILGLKPEHYIYMSDIGKLLLDNKQLFLSRRASFTFGAYANSQVRRLENKSARLVSQTESEQHILNSIRHAEVDYHNKYLPYPTDAIKLYVDKSNRPEMDSEIYMDVTLKHYPLRDYQDMWNDMRSIVKSYNKIGKRNAHAIDHNHLGKHMAHTIRLFYMCFDILEKHEINTFRIDEHNLLMDIRNGKYLDDNRQPIPEFYELVNELDNRLSYDSNNTDLPETADMEKINDLLYLVNEMVVKNNDSN